MVKTMNLTSKELIDLALSASEKAYSPYSGFCVGAALMCKSGKVYTGCNIENKSYGATNCAERTAFFNAINIGEREFTSIAIVGYNSESRNSFDFCHPCGICRQIFSEFCTGDFKIILSNSKGEIKEYTLNDILPDRF